MLKSIPKSFPIAFAFLILAATIFTSCDDNNGSDSDQLNISETVQTQENLTALSEQLTDHQLADTLSQEEPFTLFAPNDDALSKVDLSDASDAEIKAILEYHIVNMKLTLDDLKDMESVQTLSGDTLYFSTDGDSIIINDGEATLSSDPIDATNGSIFVVDTLLTPTQEAPSE